MQFSFNKTDLSKQQSDCIIIGIFEKNALTPTAKKIDKLSHGFISDVLKGGEFTGKIGQTFFLYDVPNLKTKRLLLVGCGKQTTLNEKDFRKVIGTSIKAFQPSQAKKVVSYLCELAVKNHDLPWKIKHFIEASSDALYRFNQFKSEKESAIALQEIQIALEDSHQLAKCEEALAQGLAIVAGVEFTKNLANLPSNICTPSYIAEQAKKLAKEFGKKFSVKVLEESDMKKLGMGALLAVAKGSAQDAKLICLQYHGAKKSQAPVALVGKGITFDTGGISLKTPDGMVGMKYDMCGAATVLGVLKAAAILKLPINLVGVIASAENMPGGNASKPEDIVTTMSGQTVEIMNTDAEGRLVLCDALTYCERFKPETVIDIATLTGAVVIALGYHASGLLSNHDPLAKDLLAAGTESHDRAWQMPLWDEYQEQLKSPFADMANTGGRTAGTITAACFLSRFAKKFHWAHLDVAGTAAMMGGTNDRYATGRPVPMLVQYLINRCLR